MLNITGIYSWYRLIQRLALKLNIVKRIIYVCLKDWRNCNPISSIIVSGRSTPQTQCPIGGLCNYSLEIFDFFLQHVEVQVRCNNLNLSSHNHTAQETIPYLLRGDRVYGYHYHGGSNRERESEGEREGKREPEHRRTTRQESQLILVRERERERERAKEKKRVNKKEGINYVRGDNLDCNSSSYNSNVSSNISNSSNNSSDNLILLLYYYYSYSYSYNYNSGRTVNECILLDEDREVVVWVLLLYKECQFLAHQAILKTEKERDNTMEYTVATIWQFRRKNLETW